MSVARWWLAPSCLLMTSTIHSPSQSPSIVRTSSWRKMASRSATWTTLPVRDNENFLFIFFKEMEYLFDWQLLFVLLESNISFVDAVCSLNQTLKYVYKIQANNDWLIDHCIVLSLFQDTASKLAGTKWSTMPLTWLVIGPRVLTTSTSNVSACVLKYIKYRSSKHNLNLSIFSGIFKVSSIHPSRPRHLWSANFKKLVTLLKFYDVLYFIYYIVNYWYFLFICCLATF